MGTPSASLFLGVQKERPGRLRPRGLGEASSRDLPHGLELNKDCQANAINLSNTTTQKNPWRETLEAYHFCGRAGSEIEFLQMQEEAFQLSDQQEQDDAICKLQVLCISPKPSPQHAVNTWSPAGHFVGWGLARLLGVGPWTVQSPWPIPTGLSASYPPCCVQLPSTRHSCPGMWGPSKETPPEPVSETNPSPWSQAFVTVTHKEPHTRN